MLGFFVKFKEGHSKLFFVLSPLRSARTVYFTIVTLCNDRSVNGSVRTRNNEKKKKKIKKPHVKLDILNSEVKACRQLIIEYVIHISGMSTLTGFILTGHHHTRKGGGTGARFHRRSFLHWSPRRSRRLTSLQRHFDVISPFLPLLGAVPVR